LRHDARVKIGIFAPVTFAALSIVVACSSNPTTDDGGTDDAAADTQAEGGVAVPCAVAKAGTSGVLLTGRLLKASGAVTGELLVDGSGKIACADVSCASTAGYDDATRIDCPSSVISPSLINPHDHTDYATAPPIDHGQLRYQHRNDWRTGAEGAKALKQPSTTTDPKILAAAELRFVLGGATSIVGSGGVKGLLRNLANYKDQTELEGLGGKTTFFDTFPLGDSNGTIITSGCAYPSIRTSGNAFEDGNYAAHIGEGINLGGENELTCTAQQSNNLVTNRTAIIHGIAFNAKDVDVVRAAGASLVWSPRSNMSLYGNTASVTEYHAAGVPISLGTDWLASGSMNMLRELSCADALNQKYFAGTFSDEDLWQMVTLNAAISAGFDSQIGSLDTGKVADIAVFEASTNTDYRAVIAASVEDVHLVLRGGTVLYGDAPLVAALNPSCAALDVCGNPRAVCLDVPNVAFADVQTAAQSVYPLFFCRDQAPTAEPTCVPFRDTYPDGTSSTDFDGDGIPDTSDDCPKVFNPIRPMDNAAQSDVDGDGAGDACDAKPLDPQSK
jgi:hypothetical protein